MAWKFLRRLLFAFHVCWIAAVLLLPVWAWGHPMWRLPHLTLVALTLTSFYMFGRCALTDLENRLIRKYDPGRVYEGSFIAHYLKRIIPWQEPGIALARVTLAWGVLWTAVYLLLRHFELHHR